tara:strand:+ start:806 stop:1321 length:516 start_codon:yes stop_codon:yes gene_type:complete
MREEQIQAKLLDSPIPGQSLTAARGSRPWRRPYKFTTIEEAVNYYIPRLLNAENVILLSKQTEKGIPLTLIVEAMIQSATMEGIHSLDIGVLISPVLMELLMGVLESKNLPFVSGVYETNDEFFRSAGMEGIEKVEEPLEDLEQAIPEEMQPQQEQPMQEKSRGLMARRTE